MSTDWFGALWDCYLTIQELVCGIADPSTSVHGWAKPKLHILPIVFILLNWFMDGIHNFV